MVSEHPVAPLHILNPPNKVLPDILPEAPFNCPVRIAGHVCCAATIKKL